MSDNYREGYVIGWIIVSISLMIIAIVFIILWVAAVNALHNQVSNICFGPFGVETGVDANPINQCDTNQSSPCVFTKGSLADCESQCNSLSNICHAFTFNSSTKTMKIVSGTGTFLSPSVNLYVRQSGVIST